MYDYKIKLEYKVESCISCPFRNERVIYENLQSSDVLSGVISLSRRISHCLLKNEQILFNEPVDGFNSKCPLKGNIFIDNIK